MPIKIRCVLLFTLSVLFTGCAAKTMVVLVPDPDGTTGSIIVTNEAGSVVLDKPNQMTTIKDRKTAPSTPAVIEKESINTHFSDALAIQPEPPVHFLLYFEKDAILTPESSNLITEILATIRERNSIDISVIGHADTLGDTDYNLKLSKRRALAVSNLLIEKGANSEHIKVTSHGEENLLIKTADNVSEPRNRRVEVIVR